MYDQQREAYVQSMLARMRELEQQLQAKQQETKQEAGADGEKLISNNHNIFTTIMLGVRDCTKVIKIKLTI